MKVAESDCSTALRSDLCKRNARQGYPSRQWLHAFSRSQWPGGKRLWQALRRASIWGHHNETSPRLARVVPAAAARSTLGRILCHRVGARRVQATRAGSVLQSLHAAHGLLCESPPIWCDPLIAAAEVSTIGRSFSVVLRVLQLRLHDRRRCGTRRAVRYREKPFKIRS